MKKLTLFITLISLFFVNSLQALHVSGYDMALISLGSDSYKFKLVVYRNIYDIQLPSSYSFNIYQNPNIPTSIPAITLNKLSSSIMSYNCKPDNAIFNFEKWIYESAPINLSSLNATSGYYITSGDCCGFANVNNVSTGVPFGTLYTMEFPRLNSTSPTRNNSSPEFKNPPLMNMQINKAYQLDFNVIDPNGDSLVYDITKPISNNAPSGLLIKPFTIIEFSSGYKLDSNIADGAPDFTINKNTGIINYKPKKIGNYLISIKVEEWKRRTALTSAYKIGEVRRTFIIQNVYVPEFPPKISDYKKRVKFINDTISAKDTNTYFNRFLSKEQAGDSVFMKLVPEQGVYNNIFNSSLFDVKFGKIGGATSAGTDIKELIISGKDSLKANFTWKIDSTDIKKVPYKFKVISYDKTCPTPLADTLDVELSIVGQCYNNKQFLYANCDSVVDLFGRKYFANAITIDTIKGIIGCDTIVKQFITVNKSSAATIVIEGCDSVLALDGNFYHQNSTIKTTIKNTHNCDSVITQNIVVNHKPVSKSIRGDIVINDVQVNHYYGTDLQNGLQYQWKLTNGNIISGQGTNLAEVQWLSNGTGILTCIVYDNQLNCSDSSMLSVTISTGINDIKNSNIKIYPNPTNNIINIEGLNKNENNTIQIFDVQGKLVITKTINEKGTIDISELNKGVYLIKIGEVAQRIVKM